jgi:hypothetical protein
MLMGPCMSGIEHIELLFHRALSQHSRGSVTTKKSQQPSDCWRRLRSGKARLDRAIQLYEWALERLKRIGKNAPARLVFDTKAGLATILTNLKRKLPEARMLFEEAVDLAGREATIPKTQLAATAAHFAWIPDVRGEFSRGRSAVAESPGDRRIREDFGKRTRCTV